MGEVKLTEAIKVGIIEKSLVDGKEIWELKLDTVSKIKETKYENFYVSKKFGLLSKDDVEDNGKAMCSFTTLVLTDRYFNASDEKLMSKLSNWIKIANESPEKLNGPRWKVNKLLYGEYYPKV